MSKTIIDQSARVRKEKKQTTPDAAARLNQASEEQRFHLKNRVRGEFADFMDDANGEELWLLLEIFAWRNGLPGASTNSEFVALLEAFENVMGRNAHQYLKIDDPGLLIYLLQTLTLWRQKGGAFVPGPEGWRVWGGKPEGRK